MKTAKFSMCFMGMMGKKTFLMLFSFYILCVIRAKIFATIFLSLVLTNIISYETVMLVYRVTCKSLFAQYFMQFILLIVKSEHGYPLCPSQFKSYFFQTRCKEFQKNITTSDFIKLNISWHSLVNISFGPILMELTWSRAGFLLGHCWPKSYGLSVH
jgi:hypothetical protein